MIYLYACLLGIVGGFCVFSQGAFFKKLFGQIVITLIFVLEIALAIYAQNRGNSGLLVLVMAIFVGGAFGRVFYYFIRNGGQYNFLPSLPIELKQAQNYFIERTSADFSFDSLSNLMEVSERESVLIDKYVTYCYVNMVNETCEKYNLSMDNLKEIYHKLMAIGCGQSVNGHFVALSSISFNEPLEFYVCAQHKMSDLRVANLLFDYFSGKYSPQQLFRIIEDSKSV